MTITTPSGMLELIEIFVFGSNLAGRHGAGSALHAVKHYNAVRGVGVGPTGQAYAIPTKDEDLRVLPLATIRGYVADFLAYAEQNPKLKFRIVAIGCGLAGYLPGEQYEYVVGKWSGDFSSFKTCERCHDIRKWVENNVPCACWAYGNLDEDAKETINDAYCRAPKETVGLRFGLLRRLVARDRFNKSRRAALRAAEQVKS